MRQATDAVEGGGDSAEVRPAQCIKVGSPPPGTCARAASCNAQRTGARPPDALASLQAATPAGEASTLTNGEEGAVGAADAEAERSGVTLPPVPGALRPERRSVPLPRVAPHS